MEPVVGLSTLFGSGRSELSENACDKNEKGGLYLDQTPGALSLGPT